MIDTTHIRIKFRTKFILDRLMRARETYDDVIYRYTHKTKKVRGDKNDSKRQFI